MADVFIDGTSDGSSTTNGSLVQNFSVDGSSDGSATNNGDVSQEFTITGNSDGITTINGSLNQESVNSGASDGSSNSNVIISLLFSESGNVDGASTVSDVNAFIEININGIADGYSVTNGSIVRETVVTGVSDGYANTNGLIVYEALINGTADGTSDFNGAAYLDIYIGANSDGYSSINGDMNQEFSQQAVSSGNSNTAGSLLQEFSINGTSNGFTSTQAVANLFIFFDGYSAGDSQAEGAPSDGALDVIHFVSGTADGYSTISNPELEIFNVLPFLSLVKSQIVYASPKQTVKFVFEVRDGYGQRADSPTIPLVIQIFDPSINKLPDYPQLMEQLDIGLYTFSLTMPIGPANLGDFIVDIGWTNPDTNVFNQTFYQIISRMSPSRGGGYIISVQ